jgi:hypothetical protein
MSIVTTLSSAAILADPKVDQTGKKKAAQMNTDYSNCPECRAGDEAVGGRDESIEVTTAMKAAGAYAWAKGDSEFDSPEEIAIQIFLAMIRLESRSIGSRLYRSVLNTD